VGVQEPANELDFERDVLPILREHCFDCHGPYRQKAGLRLDQRAAAMAGSSFGTDPVLVPGNRDASLLWDMISSPDEDDRMPPAKSPPLGADQIQLLGAWIDAGATWPDDGHAASWPSKHWSYQTPQSVEPPGLDVFPKRLRAWPQGEVDRFLLAAMLTAGLEPQPLADRALWFRRASLDLTGLPPSLPELDEFLGDSAPDAWERALDRLMDSPHYGEQQALRWLDLARYADSNGYEKDAERSIWPYRDWVIEAYNQDLGFDEFTRLQLAGDLLPDGGQQALIATGFQRNTMVNDEGGTDAEEYRVAAVKDRTDTLAAVWLGSTMGCAQCHNHKYDPFTQRDYYQLYAFFDQTADGGKSNEPILPVETPALLAERARALAELASFQAGRSLPQSQDSIWVGESIPEAQIVDGDWSSEPLGERRRGGAGYQQIYFTGAKRPFVVLEGDCWFVDVWVDPESPAREILIQFHVQAGNWEHRAYLGEDLHGLGRAGTGSRRALGSMPAAGAWHRIEIQPELVDLPPGSQVDGFALGQVDGFVRWGNAGLTTTNPDPSEPLPPEAAAAASTLARTVTTLVMRA
ncbi:MAG TPA: DUF1549 domain-containing protein, partial [Planctomycetota bacterium]|nr:DUF1549 domain-containing protein [Planctomycetota bacterium]